jgi:hypothetical protein
MLIFIWKELIEKQDDHANCFGKVLEAFKFEEDCNYKDHQDWRI